MAQPDAILPSHPPAPPPPQYPCPPQQKAFANPRLSSISDDRNRDKSRERPRRIANLAAMATTILRPREPDHTVRYIAQVDMQAWMVRRSKVGTTANMFVALEGTILSVYRTRSGPKRYEVNVRTECVSVDVELAELHIYVSANPSGKTRLLRLHIASTEEARKWKHALDNAVNSEITDYYSFVRSIGRGAYGEVVEASDVRTNEKRAVKIIKRGPNMQNSQHVENEIQVMKSISHPNIVRTYQIFDLKRTIYIVMEHVSGGDLFDFVSQHNCLSEQRGSQTMRSILTAVEYLHRYGIVHRDLKPENILCVNDTWPLQIKVTDFGFASFINPTEDDDRTMRTQVGTVYFMAPEIISNRGYGPGVDSWACGVILYTILTGRLPFPGKNARDYFTNVLKGRPSFPSFLWKDISPDAISLVKSLLNPDPNKRLTSLAALQHRWIKSPSEFNNEIRRDRSNLHSRRRRLFKARKAIIAVAMASKFKNTIPQVVDAVGDSTKKVVGGIEQGVKKTADGVKKVGDGLGEGTKKVAEEIGEGTKKMASGIADGTKKVAGGVGTGVKKTVDGVESGAKRVGQGVKKTADGIETGLKKTADGIGGGLKKTADGLENGLKKTADGLENGLKKTADGIGTGFKKTADGIGGGIKKTAGGIETGLKKTGEGIKSVSIHAAERTVNRGRENGDNATSNEEGSNSESTRESVRRRPIFRRRGQDSRPFPVSSTDRPPQADQLMQAPTSIPILPANYVPATVPEVGDSSDPEHLSEEVKASSSEYYSAVEEQSGAEEGWGPSSPEARGMDAAVEDNDSDVTPPHGSLSGDTKMHNVHRPTLPDLPVQGLHATLSITKKFSDVSFNSSGTPTNRPNLTPLDGLPLGLSDNSAGETVDHGEAESDTLRRAAALLLAASDTGGIWK